MKMLVLNIAFLIAVILFGTALFVRKRPIGSLLFFPTINTAGAAFVVGVIRIIAANR